MKAAGARAPGGSFPVPRPTFHVHVHVPLLRYCATALLRYCATAYCATALTALLRLLRYCATALLRYCATALLLLLRDCATALLPNCATALLRYCSTALLRYCGPSRNSVFAELITRRRSSRTPHPLDLLPEILGMKRVRTERFGQYRILARNLARSVPPCS